jgi:hypothetical protein
MARIQPPNPTQGTTRPHARMWPEIALLVGYLVICLLSVLTVLVPTTENDEEHVKTTPPPKSAAPASPTK